VLGFGPSAVLHPGRKSGELPKPMTEEDIADVITAFGSAAAAARRTGFDGVEIHGAHGYLLDQFFWKPTNQRTDRWGGSLVERTRFGAAVARAVRVALGPSLPLVFRFSQWKLGAYKAKLAETPDELAAFLEPLVAAGVDVFHCSQRRFWEPEFEGSDLNLAGWVKKLTGKPTITVGSVGLDLDFIGSFGGGDATPVNLDELLARFGRDEFDMVAVGRALLSDPAWANKVQSGRISDIKPFDKADMARLT
jgi:2,4-dienoyl-CoA reductase-like NADH-dependent reductase (Old Yellow Enzyme family)